MDLLSEVRTPQQVLNYAIKRERGQANQQEILRANSTSTWNQFTYIRQNRRPQATLPTPQAVKLNHAGNAETHSPPTTYKTARREIQYAKSARNEDIFRLCAKHLCRKEEDHPNKAHQAHNQDIKTLTHLAPETTKPGEYVI